MQEEPKSQSRVVFENIARAFGGILFFTFILFLFMGLFRTLWSLIILGPIYILFVSLFVFTSIDDLYKELVKNRKQQLQEKYPHIKIDVQPDSIGIKECRTFLRISDEEWNKKEERAIELERKARLEAEEFSKLEHEAPHGLDWWKKKNDLQYFSHSKALVEADEIRNLESLYLKAEEDKRWGDNQKQFASRVRSLANGKCKGLGASLYYVPVLLQEGVTEAESSIRIWQLFFHGFCLDKSLDYTFVPENELKCNYLSGKGTTEEWQPLEPYLYRAVIIRAIKTLRESDEEIGVLNYNDSIVDMYVDDFINGILGTSPKSAELRAQDKLFGQAMFTLEGEWGQKGSPVYKYSDILAGKKINHKKLLVLTNQVATSELISFTKQIWEKNRDNRPCICFLSLFKDFSTEEMLRLIEEQRKRIEDEKAKKRKEKELIDSIPSRVQDWEILSPFDSFKIRYLFDYYPTTVDYEVDDDDWDNRWTVWHFKNDPQKTSEANHQRALNRVIPQFIDLLKGSFGDDALKYLTLVCIPASSQEKNDSRYKEFSERLCQETGIENAFPHIHVVFEKMPKREGGLEGVVNYSFDDGYFRGKRVILFDDIITKGNSMRIAKAKLEEQGAMVVCGIALGKTRHEPRETLPTVED